MPAIQYYLAIAILVLVLGVGAYSRVRGTTRVPSIRVQTAAGVALMIATSGFALLSFAALADRHTA